MLTRASLKDDISQTTKERKAKFNDLIFRENLSTKIKPSNYSTTLSSWSDTERSSTESTNTFFSDPVNEYKLLGTKSKQKVNFLKMSLSLAPSKKYAMIEEFKHRLKGLKNILNEIKN